MAYACDIRVVDFPGLRRIRRQLSKFLAAKNLRGIVFVVNSANLDVREAAELMYDVLTDRNVDDGDVEMLIAANKSDLATSLSSSDVHKAFEVELDALKTTRATMGSGRDDETRVLLGTKDRAFTFDEDATCLVSSASISAKDGDISGVKDWFESLK